MNGIPMIRLGMLVRTLVGLVPTLLVVTPLGAQTVLQSGVPLGGQAGAQSASTFYQIAVPAGGNLVVTSSGGSGDADLYLRFSQLPGTGTGTYDCVSNGGTNSESCTVSLTQAGTYYIMLFGFSTYSGLTLTATHTVTPPSAQLLAFQAGATTITLGQSVDLLLAGRNNGGPTNPAGFISLGFPSLISPADAGEVTLLTASGGAYSEYPQGQLIYDVAGVQIPAQYLLTEYDRNLWPGGLTSTLQVRWTPTRSGTFTVEGKVALQVNAATYSRAPTSGPADQQGAAVATLTITVVGVPSGLALVAAPGGAGSGAPLDPQPVVELRDAQNLPLAQAGVVVTAGVVSGPGVLGGTTSVTTDSLGRATFVNLALTGPGTYILGFTAQSLSITSGSITITAPPVSRLALTIQPGGAQSGQPLNPQPVIELRDAQDQPVLQSGVVVTAARITGPGSLAGTTTSTTNAQGQAAFTSLALVGSGSYTLGFTAPGFAPDTSSALSITPSAPVGLAILTQPGGTVAGLPVTANPVVELRDAQDQPVSLAGVVISAAKASGPGTVTGALAVTTNAQGRSTFMSLIVTGSGVYTLEFLSPGLTKATSQSLTISTAPAVAVDSMVTALTGAGAFSAGQVAQFDCNGSGALDVGDLLCYLDANPTVSLAPPATAAARRRPARVPNPDQSRRD